MDSRTLAPNSPPMPDAFAKTVSIPVHVRGGKIVSFGGGGLPDLEDCVGDLIVPAFAVKDPEALKYLSGEKVDEVLPKGAILLCRLGGRHVPAELLERCRFEHVPNWPEKAPFVELRLEEPLHLRWRGTKKAKLEPTMCTVPALENRHVESVNEAYRHVTEVFEPQRRSAGGNVFLNVYYFCDRRQEWRPLDEVRGGLPFLPR